MISKDLIELSNRLFQNRYGLVVAAARRYAHKEDLVEDIIQQVYCDFVAGIAENKWDLEKDTGPLLYQLAKRKAQMTWRQYRQRQTQSCPTETLAERLIDSCEKRRIDEMESHDELESELKALKQCMEKLPEKSRSIVERHYFGGVSMKEIGGELHRDPSSIRHFFCRIRTKLRECIERTLRFE